jgi:predicted permease
MHEIVQEIRVALRGMSRDKKFALPVLLTLTLCVAANAGVFSVVSSVILRPLPLPEPERLVWINNSYPGAGVRDADNGVPDYYDRKELPAFEGVALFTTTGRTLGTRDGAERVTGMVATPDLFRLLRATPHRGRLLEERDGVPGQELKVVLGYGLWQKLYAGREDAIGRELRVNGRPHTVVGVLPRDFLFVDPEASFWLPLAFAPEDRADDRRHSNNYQMVGRLAPGATLEQAREQLVALNAANLERMPGLKQVLLDAGFTTLAEPLRERLVRDVRGTLYLLWGGVLFVLLIGCVNVTNLALVRATTRGREMAARESLGAGRWRLLRQLLVESLLLTSVAAVAGTLLAAVLVRALVATAAERIPRGTEIALGAPAVLLVAALALGLGTLLALIPLLHGVRSSLANQLRQESRGGTAGRAATILRRGLVAAQVAFAFVLLLGAGLLLASFQELLAVRPGFRSDGVLTGKFSLPSVSYPEDHDRIAFVERALERLRAVPGVSAAAASNAAPFAGNYNDSVILAETYQAPPGESLISPAASIVTPQYFAALGIAVLEGRPFDERDTSTSPPVVIVDKRLAEKFWRGKSPIGQRMYQPESADSVYSTGPDTRWLTVVGVVGEVKQRGLASPEERVGAYYFPFTQQPVGTMTVVARVDGDPLLVANAVRRELAALDPELPLYDVQTMTSRVEDSVAGRRAAVALATGFGLVALLLATLGIYGVLAYQVTQRTREIGIRMALGSESGRVFRLIVSEGAALLAVGILLGLAGLLALHQALASELYGVTPFEPAVLGGVTVLLGLVALVACMVPALRAARIDPAVALTE